MHDSMLGRILFLTLAVISLRYLWVRLRPIFPKKWHWPASLLFVLLLFLAFAYRIFDLGHDSLGQATFALGGFWMVALSNWLVMCLIMDFIVFLQWIRMQFMNYASLARLRDTSAPLVATVTLLVTVGFWIYGVPRQYNFEVHHEQIHVAKPLAQPLRAVVLTDIHFDPLFPLDKFQRLLEEVRKIKPDMILLGGDLSDLPSSELDRIGIGRLLPYLKAPMGVYAITGNHEAYVATQDPGQIRWFSSHGVTWLMDESFCMASVCISGRLDKNYAAQVLHQDRQALVNFAPDSRILEDHAWVLLDHQPKGIVPADVLPDGKVPDLGISGHTHAGQFFPWTLVIKLLWPLSEGYGSIGGVPWITSTGFGQWGPALRVGSKTEILVLDIVGTKK